MFHCNLYGQDAFMITYKSIKDSDTYMVGEDILYYSPQNNFSVYYEGENIFFDQRISNDSIRFNSGDYYTTYFNENKLFFRTKVIGSEYKVKEKIPLFNWQLTDEKKINEGTLLYKATVSFRERNYTAWYNPEIPIKAGPWKFSGLPGLIYEIYDNANDFKFSWYLSSLEISTERKFKTDFRNFDLTIEQFVEQLDNAYLNYKSTIDSRLSENLTVTETIVTGLENHRQKKREIKYEWEN